VFFGENASLPSHQRRKIKMAYPVYNNEILFLVRENEEEEIEKEQIGEDGDNEEEDEEEEVAEETEEEEKEEQNEEENRDALIENGNNISLQFICHKILISRSTFK